MVAVIADWFTIIGVSIAVITLFVVLFQVRQASKFEQRRKRPYVSVRYAFDELANGRRCIVLVFSNYGATPASRVRLGFPEGVIWNHVRKDADLPFIRSEGISVLYPNQTIKYLVAVSETKNPLDHLFNKSFSAQISYNERRSKFTDTVVLGLEDYAYSVRNKH